MSNILKTYLISLFFLLALAFSVSANSGLDIADIKISAPFYYQPSPIVYNAGDNFYVCFDVFNDLPYGREINPTFYFYRLQWETQAFDSYDEWFLANIVWHENPVQVMYYYKSEPSFYAPKEHKWVCFSYKTTVSGYYQFDLSPYPDAQAWAWGFARVVGADSYCGNGIIEAGEQCDDYNTEDHDACLSTCINAYCGDGYIRTGYEQCEGTNLNGQTCQSQGYARGTLSCDNCNLNINSCYNGCQSDSDCDSSDSDYCHGTELMHVEGVCNSNHQCTTGTPSVKKTCSLDCGAECASDSDCDATECDNQDGCLGHDYYDYTDRANACNDNNDCSCTDRACSSPTITYDDSRCINQCKGVEVSGISAYPSTEKYPNQVTIFCNFSKKLSNSKAHLWLASEESTDWNRLNDVQMDYQSSNNLYYYSWSITPGDVSGQEYKAHCLLSNSTKKSTLHEDPLCFKIENTNPIVNSIYYDKISGYVYCDGSDFDEQESSLLAKFSMSNSTFLIKNNQRMYWNPSLGMHYYQLGTNLFNDSYNINCTLTDSDGGIGFKGSSYIDGDGDGYNNSVDCNDSNPNVHPGFPENCTNLIDDDCDGLIDRNDSDCYFIQNNETCGNNIDDDGDHLIDEGCPCNTNGQNISCGTNIGACRKGNQTCINYTWSTTCIGSIGPITEICGNHIDDDCDNRNDEGCDVSNLCQKDSDCKAFFKCISGDCVAIQCDCGEIINHNCNAYECCSNGDCDENETCIDNKCSSKKPITLCGDGTCDDDEDTITCPEDCGSCGDDICSNGEDCDSCSADCNDASNCSLIPSLVLFILGILLLIFSATLNSSRSNREDELNRRLNGIINQQERDMILNEKGELNGIRRIVNNITILGIFSLIVALILGIYYLFVKPSNYFIECWLLGMILVIFIMIVCFINALIFKPKHKKVLEAEFIKKSENRDLTPLIIYIKKALSRGYTEIKIRELLKSTPYTQDEINKAFIIAKPIKYGERISVIKSLGPKVEEEAKRLEEVTKKLEEHTKKLKSLRK